LLFILAFDFNRSWLPPVVIHLHFPCVFQVYIDPIQ
jgi:hypothetical protein